MRVIPAYRAATTASPAGRQQLQRYACVPHRGAVTLLSPGYIRDWFMFRFEVVKQQNNTEKPSWVFGSPLYSVFSLMFVLFCLEIGLESLSLCIISVVLNFVSIWKLLREEHINKCKSMIHG